MLFECLCCIGFSYKKKFKENFDIYRVKYLLEYNKYLFFKVIVLFERKMCLLEVYIRNLYINMVIIVSL